MLYQRKSFTLPSGGRRLTDIQWEIAMGQRCKDCKEKTEDCQCEVTDSKE